MSRPLSFSLPLLVLLAGPLFGQRPVEFVRDVQPILAKHCAGCHGAKERQSGLLLDRLSLALVGGDRGAAIVPGKSGESLLIEALTGSDDLDRMPLDAEPLTDGQIVILAAWIDQGAAGPKDDAAPSRKTSDHWAFRPIMRPKVPAVAGKAWPHNAVDHFILARLEAEGIQPAARADRVTLIRRLSLDLTGLPPTIAEVDAFLADARPGAYERCGSALGIASLR